MLAQFEPDRLEKQFHRQLRRAPFLPAIARFRYWDLNRDHLEDLAKDPEDTFKKLFGQEFARAYEEQLARLKAQSRTGESTPPPSRGAKG
jgi:predicted component of type VI protein secretion system